MNRQKKGQKHKATDQQRKLDIISKISDPNFDRSENARKAELRKQLQLEHENQTRDLLIEMDTAHDDDHKLLATAKTQGLTQAPMNRFNLLTKVKQLLAKKSHQDLFLGMGGCGILEKWLRQNPDGSYPPQ